MDEQLPSDELEHQAQVFLKGLCSHLVSLAGTAVPLDSDGRPDGNEQFFSFSGFVISYLDAWVYVTAGHVLEGLYRQVQDRKVQIVHCNLFDAFGLNVESAVSCPFDFTNEKKYFIDSDENGLDFGLVRISPVYRKLMEKNNVRPLVMDGWDQPLGVEFDDYAILGLPEDLFDRQRRVSITGSTVIGGVRPVLMFGRRSDAVPEDKPRPKNPWFAVELRDKREIKSIVGMSGGPIFGFHSRRNKPPLYTVVAIQGWWDKQRRIGFGTPISVVMSLLDKEVRAVAAERKATG